MLGSAVCYGFSGQIDHSSFVYVSNSYANTTGRYVEGTTVTYECSEGFAPINGQPQAICFSDGTWTPVIPFCGGWYDVCYTTVP